MVKRVPFGTPPEGLGMGIDGAAGLGAEMLELGFVVVLEFVAVLELSLSWLFLVS